MSADVSTTYNEIRQPIDSKWDDVIRDAQNEIRILAVKKARLEQAVKIFKANKRDGVPWPGDKQGAAGAVTESQKAPAEAGAGTGEK